MPGLLQCEGTTGTEWAEHLTPGDLNSSEENQLNGWPGTCHSLALHLVHSDLLFIFMQIMYWMPGLASCPFPMGMPPSGETLLMVRHRLVPIFFSPVEFLWGIQGRTSFFVWQSLGCKLYRPGLCYVLPMSAPPEPSTATSTQ